MSEPYICPDPPRPFRRSSPYGWRIHPKTRDWKFHAGVDYKAQEGTPIPAGPPGQVVYSGYNRGYGNTVIVRTTNGDSLYAHMKEAPHVRRGQQVWPGDILGLVGNTGIWSDGPHLHYSTITSGTPNSEGNIGFNVDEEHTVDPAKFDTAIRYPNETLRARRAMFGPDDTSEALTFGDRSSPVAAASPFHRFGPRSSGSGSVFADRFGNWDSRSPDDSVSAPAVEPGGLPGLILDYMRRQRAQEAGVPASSGAGTDPVPFMPEDGEGSFADRFGDRPQLRRLTLRWEQH